MCRRFVASFFSFLMALVLSSTAFAAADHGTPDEAKDMVKKAIAYVKANGKDAFLKEASNNKGKFIDRDLYLSVYDMNGIVIAHGVNPKLLQKDVSTLNDIDGKLFIKEILVQAKNKGTGYQDYKWPHPETKQYQAKTVYFETHEGMIISCGYYKY